MSNQVGLKTTERILTYKPASNRYAGNFRGREFQFEPNDLIFLDKASDTDSTALERYVEERVSMGADGIVVYPDKQQVGKVQPYSLVKTRPMVIELRSWLTRHGVL